ncbi:hypothetical protein D3C80_1726330 [compost metagenome]
MQLFNSSLPIIMLLYLFKMQLTQFGLFLLLNPILCKQKLLKDILEVPVPKKSMTPLLQMRLRN